MKHTLLSLFLAGGALMAQPATKAAPPPPKAEASKHPVMADALKVQILQSILALRDLELNASKLAEATKAEQTKAQALLKQAEKEGYQIDRDLNYIAVPKVEAKAEVKK